MKKVLNLLLVLILMMVWAVLPACSFKSPHDGNPSDNGDNTAGKTQYYITFWTDERSDKYFSQKIVNEGEPVEAITPPSKNDYDFNSWYKGSYRNPSQEKYDFALSVLSDFHLHAEWVRKSDPQSPPEIGEFDYSLEEFKR